MTKKNTPATVDPKSTAITNAVDYGCTPDQAGYGQMDQDDLALPFLILLQDLSPQVKKNDERYVPGAEPGMLFNTVTGTLYDGAQGVIVVPCYRDRAFLAWVPQNEGGGFRGRYEPGDPVVVEAKRRAGGGINLRTGDGDKLELVNTPHLFCIVLPSADAEDFTEQVVVSFPKTKFRAYRHYMSKIRMIRGAKNVPIYANRALLTSYADRNDKGQTFYNVRLEPLTGSAETSLIPPTSPLLTAGRAFHDAITGGAVKVDYAASDAGATAGGGVDSDDAF